MLIARLKRERRRIKKRRQKDMNSSYDSSENGPDPFCAWGESGWPAASGSALRGLGSKQRCCVLGGQTSKKTKRGGASAKKASSKKGKASKRGKATSKRGKKEYIKIDNTNRKITGSFPSLTTKKANNKKVKRNQRSTMPFRPLALTN
jgi:hypothetical protein